MTGTKGFNGDCIGNKRHVWSTADTQNETSDASNGSYFAVYCTFWRYLRKLGVNELENNIVAVP